MDLGSIITQIRPESYKGRTHKNRNYLDNCQWFRRPKRGYSMNRAFESTSYRGVWVLNGFFRDFHVLRGFRAFAEGALPLHGRFWSWRPRNTRKPRKEKNRF